LIFVVLGIIIFTYTFLFYSASIIRRPLKAESTQQSNLATKNGNIIFNYFIGKIRVKIEEIENSVSLTADSRKNGRRKKNSLIFKFLGLGVCIYNIILR